ncbi:hypothetical protein BST61_g7894 [Cercospora zeina]
MARLLICLSAVQTLLVQGLPLDTFSQAGDATASRTATYGLPQQHASKTFSWMNGVTRSTNCPRGTYTGGSCYLRDTDEPTSSTLYQPEIPIPVTSLAAATSYVNGTRTEECTTSGYPTGDSTHAPLVSYSSEPETRTEVIRTIYSQQSSESTPSLPQYPSSTASYESQDQYTFSSVDPTFSHAITSTTMDTSPTHFTSASHISHKIRTLTNTRYPTALATVTAYRTRSYGLPITIWTGLSSLHSHDDPRTSEALPHPTGYGVEPSQTRQYPHVNSNTATWSLLSPTTFDSDPTQTFDPTTRTVTYFPTLDDQPTSSYFYVQPLPSASSSSFYGSSSGYPGASWSQSPQSTQSQRGIYSDPEDTRTISLDPIVTRSEGPDTFTSRYTVYPDPSASFTVIRDPIVTRSELSYTTWSQRTVYPDPSYSLTASVEIPWSTQMNYPDATDSNAAISDPTLTQSDFFDPTQSQYTVFPMPSSSDTFIWDPTGTETESWSQYTAYTIPSTSNTFTRDPTGPQTESWSQYTVSPIPSTSDTFTRDPTGTQTESWSQHTVYVEPSSSATLHVNPTVTKSTSWIYPTAYWQPTSASSDLSTTTPVQDPNTPDTTFVTVTRTAFPGTESLPSAVNYGLPTYHYHAGNEWHSGFWHRLERLFMGRSSEEGESWGEHEEDDGAGEFGRSK